MSTDVEKSHYYTNSNKKQSKQVLHFSNRPEKAIPKMALNHASVFLDKRSKRFDTFE
jgi:hypothetical protein